MRWRKIVTVYKFALADASFERSPGQQADIFTGNVLDQRHGGPVTVGFGRYGPNQILETTIAVHDTMVILEGGLSVTSNGETFNAGPGEIIAMQDGDRVTIRSHEEGAVTAYVTYPHWQEAES
nr:AraC family ligand binding domain-containing protein [Phyllobacterium endophyticum]